MMKAAEPQLLPYLPGDASDGLMPCGDLQAAMRVNSRQLCIGMTTDWTSHAKGWCWQLCWMRCYVQ
jgi:hypothetical protein